MSHHHCYALVFAVLLFRSINPSSSSASFLEPAFSVSSPSPSPSPSPQLAIPKATPSDLLSVLGSKAQSTAVYPGVAQQLTSCFKFLVPFTPNGAKTEYSSRRRLDHQKVGDRTPREEDELIWWPPEPVLELARVAVDSGGDTAAIERRLDPTNTPVPDVEGSNANRCQLTKTPTGRRFMSEELNSYMKFLFELIKSRGPSIGLNVSLNRFDLFQGHLFLAATTGRLGILFQGRDYPAYNSDIFPYDLGFCQMGSNIIYDDSMNLRNILWLAPLPNNETEAWLAPGTLVVLDARPDGEIYEDLIPDYARVVRTIDEDDLGKTAFDVNYLNTGETEPRYQIFIC